MSSEVKPLWEATSVQNLVRYRPAGTYFARFRINGKRVWKSLETTVFSVAKQRLPDTMHEHRVKLESVTAVAIGNDLTSMFEVDEFRLLVEALQRRVLVIAVEQLSGSLASSGRGQTFAAAGSSPESSSFVPLTARLCGRS